MATDWSSPLSFLCLGMILGALGLLLMLQAWKIVQRKPSNGVQAPGQVHHAVEQTAPVIQPRPRPVPPKYYLWMNLTAREKEVARLAGKEKRNSEIAGELFISPFTVANHLKHIYDKLDVNSRFQLLNAVRDIETYEQDVPAARDKP